MHRSVNHEKHEELQSQAERAPTPEELEEYRSAVATLREAARKIVTGPRFTRCPTCGSRTCADDVFERSLAAKSRIDRCEREPRQEGAGRVGTRVDPPMILHLED